MAKHDHRDDEAARIDGKNGTPEIAELLRSWAVIALGWGFVLFGIVGIVLPVLHGVIFLLVGLSILARKQAWAKRLLDRLRRRFPEAAERFDEAETRATRRLERLARRAWARTRLAARYFEKKL